jgi:hypothetical protein
VLGITVVGAVGKDFRSSPQAYAANAESTTHHTATFRMGPPLLDLGGDAEYFAGAV